MRVLHLAPPTPHRERLAAPSFIDEEILALRDTGVDSVVLSDLLERSEQRSGVWMDGVPRPTVRDRLAALSLARHCQRLATARESPSRVRWSTPPESSWRRS